MTETGSGVVYDGQPLPEVSLACDDDEILVASSPTLFRSYRDSPRPERILGDMSYFPTGDGGRFENGLLSVSGRRAYVINTGGEKVWPERLEEILRSLEGVRDLAVVGRDDDEWGQVVTLVVAPTGTAGIEDILAAARDVIREAIGPWAQPKAIYSVAAIPRTPNGKIQRSALAELIRS
jgi:O-succinylbenzoic acid--CoA ligase